MYFFYNYDVRGSVTSIIKPDGSLVKGYDYDEFGNAKESGESQFKNDIKSTGAVHDTSPGLYYMNARFYNPTTGRFLSQDTYNGDPYDPWTQNLYSYTSNNPVNYIDPTGHLMVSVTDDVAGTSADDTSVVDHRNNSVINAAQNTDRKALDSWVQFGDSVANWQDRHEDVMAALSLAMIFTPSKEVELKESAVKIQESQLSIEGIINKAISTRADKAGRSNAELVQDIATRAENKLGGTGSVAGNKKHTYARDLLNRYQKMYGYRGLETETSWLNQSPASYGTKGSAHIDVYDVNTGEVFDYKFTTNPGNACQRIK